MIFEWDEQKCHHNKEKHGVDFEDAQQVFNQDAKIIEDIRHDYGEERYILFGFLSERLVVTVFTYRENSIRIISMRKANKREQKLYDKK